MAVYSVEGKLGTGKTKFCVWRAQEAFQDGRAVASNVDLKPWLLSPRTNNRYIRLPDKPTADDFEAMGHGNPDSYDEDKNGVLILDELGTWLNARSFQDKSRAGVIDWFIHARKKGWDVYFIVQDAGMIDKQVREALIEYECKCMRMDKVRIPVIGTVLKQFDRKWGYLPKFHMVAARVGQGAQKVVAERWAFRGLDLHQAYDTRQVFISDYPHGAHSVLAPWDHIVSKGWLTRLLDRFNRYRLGYSLKIPPKPKSKAIQLIAQLPDKDERIKLLMRYLQAREKASSFNSIVAG